MLRQHLTRRAATVAAATIISTAALATMIEPTAHAQQTVVCTTKHTGTSQDGGYRAGSSKVCYKTGETPAKVSYCQGENDALADVDEAERVVYTPGSRSKGLYQYADGRQDSVRVDEIPAEEITFAGSPVLSNTNMVVHSVVRDGGPPMYEQYEVWCEPDDGGERTKQALVWVPLMDPDGVAERLNLYAQVVAALPRPEVTFIDQDLDYGWLWVRVPHHLTIDPPETIRRSATDTDPTGWSEAGSVTAWLEATPISFSIQVQQEAGETELGSCDLAQVTSDEGCTIRFTHATAITDDELFHGTTTIEWSLASNAGTLNGFGPITTNAFFSTQVGEAMAVTRYD